MLRLNIPRFHRQSFEILLFGWMETLNNYSYRQLYQLLGLVTRHFINALIWQRSFVLLFIVCFTKTWRALWRADTQIPKQIVVSVASYIIVDYKVTIEGTLSIFFDAIILCPAKSNVRGTAGFASPRGGKWQVRGSRYPPYPTRLAMQASCVSFVQSVQFRSAIDTRVAIASSP